HLDTMRIDPVPLSPGDKMRIRVRRGQTVEVLDCPAIQQRILNLTLRRFGSLETMNKRLALTTPRPVPNHASSVFSDDGTAPAHPSSEVKLDNRMSAFGWGREDREWLQELAENGNDPISSLGYDGPLAPLSRERQNVADYFKEAVAVVTNPAVDREREVEHFSTQAVIGPRPPLLPLQLGQATTFAFDTPILLDDPRNSSTNAALIRKVAAETGCPTLGQLTDHF